MVTACVVVVIGGGVVTVGPVVVVGSGRVVVDGATDGVGVGVVVDVEGVSVVVVEGDDGVPPQAAATTVSEISQIGGARLVTLNDLLGRADFDRGDRLYFSFRGHLQKTSFGDRSRF